MPIFALPLAFAALASLPILAAIYWMRSRHRTQTVSTLSLWIDQRTPREGGRRIERLQLPLLFLLELLALLLLTAAAAGPVLRDNRVVHKIIIVLDDSYSMRANATPAAASVNHTDKQTTPHSRAIAAIHHILGDHQPYSVRFILAGPATEILGSAVTTRDQVDNQLKAWRCRAPAADLDQALATARRLAGHDTDLLVITDHKPDPSSSNTHLQWRAFGRPLPNIAFINAVRSHDEAGATDHDRVLLEIANLSDHPAHTILTIDHHATALDFTPQQVRRLWLDIPPGTGAVHASLTPDALAMDNHVILLAPPRKLLRVRLAMAKTELARQVRRALLATGRVHLITKHVQLLITDHVGPGLPGHASLPPAPPTPWRLQFILAAQGPAYLGPFVFDRASPLTRGLSLNGVVWAVGKPSAGAATMPGHIAPGLPGEDAKQTKNSDNDGGGNGLRKADHLPRHPRGAGGYVVIAAGNVPLLTDTTSPGGGHIIRLHLVPDESTLARTPALPILMWNLIDWRLSHTPGLQNVNIPLGAHADLALPHGIISVLVTSPAGKQDTLAAPTGQLQIAGTVPGVYAIESTHSPRPPGLAGGRRKTGGGETTSPGTPGTPVSPGKPGAMYRFAVNTLDQRESNLTAATTGQWGQWSHPAGSQPHDLNLAWLAVLLALGVLSTHAVLAGRIT